MRVEDARGGRSAVIVFRDRSMTADKMIRDDWGPVRLYDLKIVLEAPV